MACYNDDDHIELVERLILGFKALLNQVNDLAKKNQELEQRLSLTRNEVRSSTLVHCVTIAMKIRFSSRPVAPFVAVMNQPTIAEHLPSKLTVFLPYLFVQANKPLIIIGALPHSGRWASITP